MTVMNEFFLQQKEKKNVRYFSKVENTVSQCSKNVCLNIKHCNPELSPAPCSLLNTFVPVQLHIGYFLWNILGR